MKKTKNTLAILLSVLIVCTFLLSGCTGQRAEVKDLEKAATKAAMDWYKNYVTTEMKDCSYNKDYSEVTEIEQTEDNHLVITGVLGVKERETGEIKQAKCRLELLNADYVGMPTATFKMLSFDLEDFEPAVIPSDGT